MGKRFRRRNKRQVRLVVIGTIIMLGIITTGYAAFSTNISLNAKGNIIKNGITIEELKTTKVTSGDGLYDNGDGTYTYKGADPNNYLTLGSDDYRIMGIETDGTLKVVKTTSLGRKVWDPGYESNITVTGATKATTTTDGTRFQGLTTSNYCVSNHGTDTAGSASSYGGCKVWGNADTMRNSSGTALKDTASGAKMPKIVNNSTTYNLPNDEAYINYYLNNDYLNNLSYKSLIEIHSFDVGLVGNDTNQTLATDISQAHTYTWQGKVGLMTVIDYVKANTNTSLCGTVNLNTNSTNATTCKATNWLASSNIGWLMSPFSTSSTYSEYVWFVYSNGSIYARYAEESGEIRPVIHLASCIQLRGEGTSGSPYTVTNASSCQANSSSSGSGGSSSGSGSGSSSGSGGGSSQSTQVYDWNISGVHIGSSTLQDIGTTYNSCSATNHPMCLRHTIENNTVVGAEVCFVYNNVEYCLIGGDDGAASSTNLNTLQTAFGANYSSYCYDDDLQVNCTSVPGFRAIYVAYNGDVDVRDDNLIGCTINNNDIDSWCVES